MKRMDEYLLSDNLSSGCNGSVFFNAKLLNSVTLEPLKMERPEFYGVEGVNKLCCLQ